jgi:hypothetical protein
MTAADSGKSMASAASSRGSLENSVCITRALHDAVVHERLDDLASCDRLCESGLRWEQVNLDVSKLFRSGEWCAGAWLASTRVGVLDRLRGVFGQRGRESFVIQTGVDLSPSTTKGRLVGEEVNECLPTPQGAW